ncbi:MAG: hypothetical protein ACI4OZ_09265 [Akkermansia sp.]
MKKYIHIDKQNREFLASAFQVTQKTVLNAIRFDENRGNTDLARRIRKLAMQRGGIIMAEAPLAETIHDSDGYMRQYLPNGALLEFSKHPDGGCDVFHRGIRVRHYDQVLISDIPRIQHWAASL